MANAMGKIKDFVKRGRWLRDSRAINFTSWCSYNWIHRIWNASKRCIQTNAHKKRRPHDKHRKFWLLSDIRGITTSAEIMFYVPLLAFLLFSGVDYYLTSMQHNNLESRKNYYLDIMRIEGTYTLELDTMINTELANMGFENITITPARHSGSALAGTTLYRDVNNPTSARMSLKIEAEPKFEPFVLGRLLGVKDEAGDFKFVVKGEALSEKPNY